MTSFTNQNLKFDQSGGGGGKFKEVKLVYRFLCDFENTRVTFEQNQGHPSLRYAFSTGFI